MFPRRALSCGLVLALASGACTTPVSIDWGKAGPTPTPTPEDGGAVTWLSARQTLDTDPIASQVPIAIEWSPVPGVTSWNVFVDDQNIATVEANAFLIDELPLDGAVTVQVRPSAAVASTPAIGVTIIPVNRQSVIPFGRLPGATLSLGTPSGSCFGKSLTALDTDGQPGTDLLVGAPWNGSAGALVEYRSNANGTFTNAGSTPGAIQNSRYGWSQAALSAPGAAIIRVAVGAPDNAGAVHMWDNDPTTSVAMPTAALGSGAHLGFSLSARDLNADTLPELLAGAPRTSSNGALVLYPQDAGGLVTPFISFGFTSGEHLGYSVALATDLIDDVDYAIAGGPFFGATDNGQVSAFPVSVSDGIGTAEGSFVGANGNRAGTAVLAPGDVTNDGKPDFIAGLPGADVLRIVRGSNSSTMGQLIAAAETLPKPAAISGSFGTTLFEAPDVTFDMIPDFLVGVPGHASGTFANAGAIALYQGATGFSSAQPRWGYAASQSDTFAGASAAIGDFDDDGYLDLAVGAAQCDVFAGTTIGAHESVRIFFSPPDSGAMVKPSSDVFTGGPGDAISFDHALTAPGIGGDADCTWDWDESKGGLEATVPCGAVEMTHAFADPGEYEPLLRVESYGLITVTKFRVVIE